MDQGLILAGVQELLGRAKSGEEDEAVVGRGEGGRGGVDPEG